VVVPDPPWLIGRKVGETVPQIPECTSERVIVVVADRFPEVPVMVIGMFSDWRPFWDSVKTAVSLALRVSMLEPVAGFALHEAVTPFGS
jgi:hypothetical protein